MVKNAVPGGERDSERAGPAAVLYSRSLGCRPAHSPEPTKVAIFLFFNGLYKFFISIHTRTQLHMFFLDLGGPNARRVRVLSEILQQRTIITSI